ncbi:MAG: CPBP family intramembrane metalloprotease [Tissierellia bacterium]|nr:CPBP family intramembrane metalloprotease [Tissierellia bacterium]
MKNKKLYIYPVIYFLLSVIGFAILNYFGIQYDDPRIHFYAIPMMLVISGFVIWANEKSLLLNKEDFIPNSKFALLNWIPILTILMAIASLVEAIASKGDPTKIIWAIILTFLIGFSEEGLFRKFLISEGEKEFSSLKILIYSTLVFGLLHMANIASGLSFTSALIQSAFSLPFGLLAGFLFMETKNISAMIFWHMSVDYSLFLSELGDFKSATIFGYIIDLLLVISVLILLYKKLKKKKTC